MISTVAVKARHYLNSLYGLGFTNRIGCREKRLDNLGKTVQTVSFEKTSGFCPDNRLELNRIFKIRSFRLTMRLRWEQIQI